MPAAVRQDAPQTCNEIEYITENNSQEIDYVEKKKRWGIEPGQSPNWENEACFAPLSYTVDSR